MIAEKRNLFFSFLCLDDVQTSQNQEHVSAGGYVCAERVGCCIFDTRKRNRIVHTFERSYREPSDAAARG